MFEDWITTEAYLEQVCGADQPSVRRDNNRTIVMIMEKVTNGFMMVDQ